MYRGIEFHAAKDGGAKFPCYVTLDMLVASWSRKQEGDQRGHPMLQGCTALTAGQAAKEGVEAVEPLESSEPGRNLAFWRKLLNFDYGTYGWRIPTCRLALACRQENHSKVRVYELTLLPH